MNKQSIACLLLGSLLLLSLAGGYPAPVMSTSLSPVTTPFEFQPGTPVRAAEMNENFLTHEIAINDNSTRLTALEGSPTSVPAFRAVVGGATTGTGTGTVVCDNEVLDDGGGYDSTTGVFTAPRAGVYQLSFITSGARTGIANISMVKNGVISLGTVQIIINHTGSIVLTEVLAAGDMVEVTRNQTTDLFGTQADGPFTVFSGHLIRGR